MKEVIRVEGVSIRFGSVNVVNGVSFHLGEQEILAIIGPNGAGKTCLLNAMSGIYPIREGKIYFGDKEISGVNSYKIAQLGIARTFQNLELYTSLTTLDNIMAGRHIFLRANPFTAALYFGWAHREELRHRRIAEEIIDFLEIQIVRNKIVGTLPYGVRKRVELGRALALEPKVLLLDEVMAGMNAEEKEDMARFILDIHEERGVPIILVEHDMEVVTDLAQRIIVLDFGVKIAEGSPEEIMASPVVIGAYLGKGEATQSVWDVEKA